MIDHLQRSDMFRKMVRESTDPQYIRETFDRPHQYSRTFIIAIWFIGFMAAWGIVVATASI